MSASTLVIPPYTAYDQAMRFMAVITLLVLAITPAQPLAAQSFKPDLEAGYAAFEKGDFASALKHFGSLAEQGHARAQLNLGLMHAYGNGVTKDDKEAVRWFRKAADQGDADAEYSLAGMYRKGWGLTQNYAEAVRWYRLAAKQGDAEAQYWLGVMYDNGAGVTKDLKKAAHLYRKAAEQGYALAQLNLGVMYANGEGVMHDDVMAYVWTNVSAANGNEAAPGNIKFFAERLEKADLRKAQKLSRRCLKMPASCPKYSFQ